MKLFEFNPQGAADHWRIVERDMKKPDRLEVAVKLHAAALNFRDVLFAKGVHGFPRSPEGLVPLSDGAGEVVEVGEGVTRVKPGDRVAGLFSQGWFAGSHALEGRDSILSGSIDGVLSEYRIFDQQGLVKIPDHLSFEEASTLPCAALTAWNALYGLKPLQSGQTVLVLGTGGVSTFALQFASAAGARVIATSSSDTKLEKARSLGATDTINYAQCPKWDEEVKRLTGGSGVDNVIEVGGPGTLQCSIRCARPGGIVSIIGMLAQGSMIDPMPILSASCILRGVLVGSRELFEAMNRTIAWHQIHPAVDRIFAFEEANAALAYLESGAHVGKVVIRIA